jgi:hypothetical protein
VLEALINAEVSSYLINGTYKCDFHNTQNREFTNKLSTEVLGNYFLKIMKLNIIYC